MPTDDTDAASPGTLACDICTEAGFVPCTEDERPDAPMLCESGACLAGVGCVACVPGVIQCEGLERRRCAADGSGYDELVETCDGEAGQLCVAGWCQDACALSAEQPSNVGCEFWAVDLDQTEFGYGTDAPWGIAVSNTNAATAHVVVELNESLPGAAPSTRIVDEFEVAPSALHVLTLPTREVDCSTEPNDADEPGTCLSSNAFRIRASLPVVASQYNTLEHSYSNDASLLLPTSALGTAYRVLGWPVDDNAFAAGVPSAGVYGRAYVTIIGTTADTEVTVKPSFRILGNPPVAATLAGGEIRVRIGMFDVLNLETDTPTDDDDPATWGDLSGTLVTSSQPVAVFTGSEMAWAPARAVLLPPPPSLDNPRCCADHLEEQLFPITSVGSGYVIGRSPVRSAPPYREPDILRFLGVAEDTTVETTLPAPFDSFTLRAGEVRTTWTRENVVIQASRPLTVAQILVSAGQVDGIALGDPSLTILPPVTQFRSEYIVHAPSSWPSSWLVITGELGTELTIDADDTSACLREPAGELDGRQYESLACPIEAGSHHLVGDSPFGVVLYGWGDNGSYALAGGADVKRVYDPPILR